MKTCKDCHHAPSCRFDATGRQCYCGCHDVADAGPMLLAALESLLRLPPENRSSIEVEMDLEALVAKARVAASTT